MILSTVLLSGTGLALICNANALSLPITSLYCSSLLSKSLFVVPSDTSESNWKTSIEVVERLSIIPWSNLGAKLTAQLVAMRRVLKNEMVTKTVFFFEFNRVDFKFFILFLFAYSDPFSATRCLLNCLFVVFQHFPTTFFYFFWKS